jgi:hypothetical protein
MRSFRPVHRSGYDREADDYYPTPGWVTACLLRHVRFRGVVWEPCCGDGAIARVLQDHGYSVIASDAAERGFGLAGVNFFDCTAFPPDCGAMVTNPPYGDGGAARTASNASSGMLSFVRHGLTLAKQAGGQLALLVRFQWIAGRRAAELISAGPLQTVLVLTRRIRWFEMGERTKTGQHHHAWIIFDYAHEPHQPPRIVFSE